MIYKQICLGLSLLGMFVASPIALAEEDTDDKGVEVAARQERIKVDVVRARRQRTEGGDYDDQLDRITLELKFQNQHMNQKFEDLTATVWVIGESQRVRGVYKVLTRQAFDFKLGIGKEGGTHEEKTAEVVSAWDNTDVVHGYRYQGWVVALQDKEGKVIAWKATRPNWQNDVAEFFPLKNEATFDRKYKEVASPESTYSTFR